jgi:prevent-host-death family protein
MDTVSHRELRNRSGEILRRVEAGESVQITNRGKPVALVSPLAPRSLDALVDQGGARRAKAPLSTLSRIRRAASTRDTHEIIRDTRGRW